MYKTLVLTIAVLVAACGSGSVRTSGETGAVAPAPSPANSPPVSDPDPAPTPGPVPDEPSGPPAAEPDTASARPDSSTSSAPAPGSPAGEVEIRRIGRWASSGIKGTRRLVIREAATFAAFWNELGAGVRPTVDFSRDLVIAVASGERMTGGHDITVQRVTRSGGDLRIVVVETKPGTGCMTTSALTQPVDVILAPAAGVTGWSFIDQTATGAC